MKMEESDSECTLCEKRGIKNVEAITWCPICEEAFCHCCNEVHAFSRPSSKHEVIEYEKYRKLPPFIASLKHICEKHNEPLKLFCPAHKEPCCCDCTTSAHRTCHGFQSIGVLSKDIASTSFLLDFECTVNELCINVEKIYNNRNEVLTQLDENVLKTIAKIRNTREKINKILDENEKELINQLYAVQSSHKESLKQVISDLEKKKDEIKKVQSNVEDMKIFASEYQIFLGVQLLSSKVETEDHSLRKLFANDHTLKQKNVEIHFTPGPIENDKNLLGKLEVKEVSCEFPIQKNASLEVALPIENFRNIKEVKLRTNSKFQLYDGNNKRNIAGCAFLENGKVLFSDWSDNKELIIFDETGKNIRNIVLDKKAFDISYTGQNCIAMTFPDSKQVAILDLKSRTEKSRLKFENRCWGLTRWENNLFVREFSAGIHCLDLQGKLIKTLPVTGVTGYITHIASCGGKLYYTEHTPDVVHCCDIDGNEIWQLQLEGKGAPKGITVGRYGFVFVVLETERRLIVISPDGMSYDELLNEDNGLQEPHAVAYDKERNKLLLVKDKTGLAELYDVLY